MPGGGADAGGGSIRPEGQAAGGRTAAAGEREFGLAVVPDMAPEVRRPSSRGAQWIAVSSVSVMLADAGRVPGAGPDRPRLGGGPGATLSTPGVTGGSGI